ncbi:type VI secretion system protein TssA [Planctobacterium marinum]|uniref:type VI secretion system protein TssA n=1 Tax=Planctobacterium marinum TaxID=1631968 RepID=UPI001E5C9F65|nr:type VI secretion system protein TssA [Planctobacterium marinum]MCC2604021.1 type VI secretion system protein TssA [Planctobacterium marinum]
MSTDHNSILQERFGQMCGVPVDALLQPIAGDNPSGEYLKHHSIYASLKSARTADDASVPMGQWEHDLKAADWDEVSRLALETLETRSKDLQIAIWLLEAQINKWGFSAIGPIIYFIQQLCETFWDSLYPEIEDDDLEYRTNLIIWINQKLLPTVKQLSITATRGDAYYSWSDWELSAQHEQLPAETRKKLQNDLLQTQTIVSSIIATPIEFYKEVFTNLKLGILALEQFSASLDDLCGRHAPSLSGLTSLLEDIHDTLYSHVKHRGLEAAQASDEDESEDNNMSPDMMSAGSGRGPIRNRQEAYAKLAEAAEYLSHDDPHSPVPYLVYKAIEWGQMNTAELYQELFIQYQGQLNIFEVMGLELDPKQAQRR